MFFQVLLELNDDQSISKEDNSSSVPSVHEEDQEVLQQLKNISVDQLLNMKQEVEDHEYDVIMNESHGYQALHIPSEVPGVVETAEDVEGLQARNIDDGDQHTFQISDDGQTLELVNPDGEVLQLSDGKKE